MAKSKWNREAPWDEEGCLLHYPRLPYEEKYYNSKNIWRPVEQFKATLTYDSFTRGRSAAYFLFKDELGRKQPMFLKEFDSVVHHLVEGTVSGIWTVTKRGQNFGLKLVEAQKQRKKN